MKMCNKCGIWEEAIEKWERKAKYEAMCDEQRIQYEKCANNLRSHLADYLLGVIGEDEL